MGNKKFNIMSKEDGKAIFSELGHLLDLSENLCSILEAKDEVDNDFKTELSEDVITQIIKTHDKVMDNYLEWYQGGQKYDPKRVRETEVAIAEVYNQVEKFVEKCNEIPSLNPIELSDEESHKLDNIKDSPVLATVGEKQGEIQQGGVWESLNNQIKRLPELKDLILSVRACTIHLWRVADFFVRKQLSFVENILKMVPMRRAAELRQEQSANRSHANIQELRTNSSKEVSRNMGGYTLSY